MKEKKYVKSVAFPLVAALIWGFAFVFQRIATGHVDAFTFNAARSTLAVAALSLFLTLARKKYPMPRTREGKIALWKGAVVTGVLLYIASSLQQMALADTEAGKAGFVTALYIVLVPVGSLLMGRKVPKTLWISVLAAAVGLYLLCINGSFRLAKSDLQLLLCAAVYAVYILAVDHYVKDVNPVAMSCIHIGVSGVLCWISAFLYETPRWADISQCIVPLLYVGIMSSGVAYTLELLAQQAENPVTVTVLLSQESTFSVIAGALVLREMLSGRELLGCVFMLAAVLLAQLPDQVWKRKKRKQE